MRRYRGRATARRRRAVPAQVERARRRAGRDPEPRINIQIYVTINVP